MGQGSSSAPPPCACPFEAGRYGIGTHPTKGGGTATIRVAESGDAATILRLIRDLAVYEKEPVSTVEVTEAEFVRDGWGPAPLFRVLLADVDGEAVGFALFHHTYSTWQGKCVYLEDLYVAEAARGRGVGTLLLKTVGAVAHGEGCKRFNWQALDWNTPALDFYKALGAARLDSWVNLRVGKAELPKLLGLADE